nr:uncharacterized protein [uncultured bacterium]
MKSYGIKEHELSAKAVREVAWHSARDIQKLAIYQEDSVDPIKFFGYLAFWVRKLKPVRHAVAGGEAITDINEKLSVWILVSAASKYVSESEDVFSKDDALAISDRLKRIVSDGNRMDYLVHCMRARTFGPHHYVIILQQAIYGC